MINSIIVDENEPSSYKKYRTDEIVQTKMTRERGLDEIIGRFPALNSYFDCFLEGDKILEIGSGSGKLGKDLIEKYKIKYRGVDLIDPKYIDKKHYIKRDLINNLDGFPQETVNFILSFFCTQYLPNTCILRRDAYNMLKPGGMAFINTGVYGSMSETIKRKMVENNPEGSVIWLANNEIIQPKFGRHIGKMMKYFTKDKKLTSGVNMIYDDILILTKQENTQLRIPEKYIARNGEGLDAKNYDGTNKGTVENGEKFFDYYDMSDIKNTEGD